MSHYLSQLLEEQNYRLVQGSMNRQIEGLAWDTRTMKKNTLFICVKNRNVNRHLFAREATQKGAIALIVEDEITDIPDTITVIKVKDTRKSMSLITQIYYGRPIDAMKTIGVTGTNGKTSTSFFISQLLTILGNKVGLIGTIQNSIAGEELKTEKLNPTTPDAIELQASLAEMREKGATHVAMEVTSSALAQHRVYGCLFDLAIFTNLTQDHLEEHGTMEAYKEAKMKLFYNCRLGIINVDDEMGKGIVEKSICKAITYGIDSMADLRATNIQYSPIQVNFDLVYKNETIKVIFKVPGVFSVYNVLAVIGCGIALGYDVKNIAGALKEITSVPGRFQVVPNNREILTIVDYAHSPDSLKKILISARHLTRGRLIVVFGCGGDRDKGKRPIMGGIAGEYADFSVITSDNPRTEDPEEIMIDIEHGLKMQTNAYTKMADRKRAIDYALTYAQQNDTVVIAGKGHEDYQIIGTEKIHLDDVEIVEDWFK